MVAEGKVTTDRNYIEQWIEDRHGWPAVMPRLTTNGIEMALSIVFPDCEPEGAVRRITWEEFFAKFDQQKLVFMYEELSHNQQLSLNYAFV